MECTVSDPIPILAGHPLVGTWRTEDPDDLMARFVVRAGPRGFVVSGLDTHGGEPFVISDVSWDGKVLRFVSLMESTSHRVEHEFSVLDRDRIHHRFTLVEQWVREAE